MLMPDKTGDRRQNHRASRLRQAPCLMMLLTPGQECIVFELAPDSTHIRCDAISDPRVLADSFDAVITGIAMLRDGQIS